MSGTDKNKDEAKAMEDATKSHSGNQDLLKPDSEVVVAALQSIELLTKESFQTGKAGKRKYDPYRLVGVTLGNRYRLEEYAGGGGMGAVYRGYKKDSDQEFAIKILKPDIMATNPKYVELFQQEVEAARQLNHPNIVKLYDSGFDDNISFMVMEWLDGHTLEEVLQSGRLEIGQVIDIFGQICTAFSIAHNRHLAYRTHYSL
jgi:serine/threonine protein kinase